MSSNGYFITDPTNFKSPKSKRRVFGVLALIAALVVGTLYIQTTLAANISLNSEPVEFGQGIAQTVACSGSQSLTITPLSSFENASGSGSYKFSGIRVENIPTSCQDKNFTFSAYDNVAGSAAQALFNTSSSRAAVYMKSDNTFEVGGGGTGLSVTTNSDSSFTITFTTPVAPSSDIYKITIESGEPVYSVGDTGPGGGIIFYYSATGFSCGQALSLSCNYLEAAPGAWNGGVDPIRRWASETYEFTNVNNATPPETAVATAIGWGYRNTRAIVLQGNTDIETVAAAIADAYSVTFSNVVYDDWFLPSIDELNELFQKRLIVGGFNTDVGSAYYSSTESQASEEFPIAETRVQAFWRNNSQGYGPKATSTARVRPIRAF